MLGRIKEAVGNVHPTYQSIWKTHLTAPICLQRPSLFLSKNTMSPGRLPNPASARNLPCMASAHEVTGLSVIPLCWMLSGFT